MDNGFSYCWSKSFVPEYIYYDKTIFLKEKLLSKLYSSLEKNEKLEYFGYYDSDRNSASFSSKLYNIFLDKISLLLKMCLESANTGDEKKLLNYINELDDECILEFLIRSEESFLERDPSYRQVVVDSEFLEVSPERIDEITKEVIEYGNNINLKRNI